MKTIEINDNKTIAQLQEEFSASFPHLKIEFFSEEHQQGEASSNRKKYDTSLKFGEIRTIHTEGELSIDGHLKTATLEENFQKLYGVNVQVLRKSGNIWLQTTTTDEWTLAEQERKGVEFDL